jgi:hypothetical protein
MTSLLTKIKSLDTKILTNTQNISNKQNILIPGTNISISNNTISATGSITQSQLNLKQDILQAGENITISNNIISSTGGITQSQLTTELNKKQNNLNIYDNIILNSLYVAPFSTKTTTSPAINGEIRSKILTIEDDIGLINVGDSINSILSTLDTKQNILTAGTNITISNNTISATSGTDLTSSSDIITGTIDSGNITGRAGSSIRAPALLYGTTNVATKISGIESSLLAKQASLTTSTNLNVNAITCGNISARTTTTTITAGTITASSNLLYGTTNVGSKISSIETSLNGKQSTLIAGNNITISNNTISLTGGITQADLDLKQNFINDGDLSFAKTSGLQAAITSLDKLAPLIYVNNQLTKKQNTLIAGTNITISGNNISSTVSTITQADLDTKQNTLTSSTDILTNRIDVADKLVITNTSPTLYLKDTDGRSGMINMNINRMYFLSGPANSESWAPVNSQYPLYLQTDTNDAVFGRNISSPRWRVLFPVNNLSNQFPSNSGTIVTIANNVVCNGGGMIFHFTCGGFMSGTTGKINVTLRYTDDAGNVRASVVAPFYFNQSNTHAAWSKSHYQAGIPASNMKLELVRDNTSNFRMDSNDFVSVVMEEVPF